MGIEAELHVEEATPHTVETVTPATGRRIISDEALRLTIIQYHAVNLRLRRNAQKLALQGLYQ